MNRLVAFCLALPLSGCMAEAPVQPTPSEEALLARHLQGRAAGPTVACVNQRGLGGNRSIGEGVILFDGPGNLIYVNRPAAGCPELRPGRALVIRTPSTRLCRGDIGSVVDPQTSVGYGGCTLGDFTPYRRID